MKKYRFAVFDLDGTLLNTIGDLTAAVNFALEKHGMPKRTEKDTAAFLGNGAEVLIALSVPGGKENPSFSLVLSSFKEYYAANNTVFTKPYKGIEKVLNSLDKKGIKYALVSNKFDKAVKLLEKKYFEGRFETAVGEYEGIKRKPAPDLVLKAMENMNAPKDQTVYIGDSEVDIKTAQNCGIDCISVSWGFRSREELAQSGAKTIIDTPDKLLEFF